LDVNNIFCLNFEEAQITPSKVLSYSDISVNHKEVNAKSFASFGYVTGLKNNSFNAIKVFKTKVMRSQRNGKENTKMKYCRLVAAKSARRLTTGSILNNLKLEE
jgi:hypothetical protein